MPFHCTASMLRERSNLNVGITALGFPRIRAVSAILWMHHNIPRGMATVHSAHKMSWNTFGSITFHEKFSSSQSSCDAVYVKVFSSDALKETHELALTSSMGAKSVTSSDWLLRNAPRPAGSNADAMVLSSSARMIADRRVLSHFLSLSASSSRGTKPLIVTEADVRDCIIVLPWRRESFVGRLSACTPGAVRKEKSRIAALGFVVVRWNTSIADQ